MAPKASRRGPSSSNATASSSPPAPFTAAPSNLSPLLSRLSRSHIYISHVDVHDADYKRRIFLIPVVLNAVFLALVLWRAYAALPTYLALLWTALGQKTTASIDASRETWGSLTRVILKRTAMFLMDFIIFRVVGSWPWTFFFEMPENPCTWRWKLGFRQKEVVVRISRNWGVEELLGGIKKGSDSPYWSTKVAPAVEREWMRAKTGYLMMGKEWDLDFGAMVEGQRAIDCNDVAEDELDGLVLAFWDGQWVAWYFREQKDRYGMTEEEGHRQMNMLRDRLAETGKEGLFFRMIELVQYEGSTPGEFGGFSPERQQVTLEKIKRLFADSGVDLEQTLNELGVELPGARGG